MKHKTHNSGINWLNHASIIKLNTKTKAITECVGAI